MHGVWVLRAACGTPSGRYGNTGDRVQYLGQRVECYLQEHGAYYYYKQVQDNQGRVRHTMYYN